MFRRKFQCKMWPVQVAFLLCIARRIFLSSLAVCNISVLTRSVQPIFSSTFQNYRGIADLLSEVPEFQHHIILCSQLSVISLPQNVPVATSCSMFLMSCHSTRLFPVSPSSTCSLSYAVSSNYLRSPCYANHTVGICRSIYTRTGQSENVDSNRERFLPLPLCAALRMRQRTDGHIYRICAVGQRSRKKNLSYHKDL
jgi:hypothetical protein